MPKYRFAWRNLPPALIARLADALGLVGDPVVALMERYGARPKPIFVQDTWPTLLATWLSDDSTSRQYVVNGLLMAGLGDITARVDTEQEQLDYLASCRNAGRLREVVVAAFVLAGEHRRIEVPSSVSSTASSLPDSTSQTRAVTPATGPIAPPDSPGTDLGDWLDDVLKYRFGVLEIPRDDDGDIPLPLRGSAAVFIRGHEPDSPYLEIFSPVLQGFEMSPDVYEAANTINAQLAIGKATVWTENPSIVLNTALLTETLTARQLNATLEVVSASADHFDTLLKKRFGGHTMSVDVDDEIDA